MRTNHSLSVNLAVRWVVAVVTMKISDPGTKCFVKVHCVRIEMLTACPTSASGRGREQESRSKHNVWPAGIERFEPVQHYWEDNLDSACTQR
ncbi:hypothetical protein RRG08_013412 [Elysia crispata]|uniref:Secreted protein n=1 Tax=Elysia crispata TaxID=231223 RepID=A0AAE0ZNI9_9GAST|nr:hypothetical protein RRG08_013412 [Elysia crispata]